MTAAARLFAAAAFAAVVLGSGVLHGRWTGRWQPLPPLDEPVARLDRLPAVVGPWQGADNPLPADELARAGIVGHVHRRFRNPATGDEATLLVVVGRPGPISVHTPDVCYRGAGWEPIGEPARADVRAADGSERPAWALRFRRPNGLPGRELEVHWGWTTGGGRLEAPANSRITYATAGHLYKVYVVRERPPGGPPPAADADPVRALLPAVEAALATPPG